MNSPIALSLIRKNKNESAAKTRERCGKISGIVGIVLNTLLAAGKIAVGAIFGAISVTADGLNNLTDCGSNAVSFIGFRMSGKPADKEHPFGHRRAAGSTPGTSRTWRIRRPRHARARGGG